MTEKKGFLHKLWQEMTDQRHQKPLLILISLLSLLLLALIVIPRVLYRSRPVVLERTAEDPPAVTATAEAAPASRLVLQGWSWGGDLLITVSDGMGGEVTGQRFRLAVTAPDGSTRWYDTELDGSCYLILLAQGEYRVSMEQAEGFALAEPIVCTVLPGDEESQPAEITMLEGEDAPEDIRPYETANAPEEAVPEELTTPPEAEGVNQIVTEQRQLLDAQGKPVYQYQTALGPHGFLLYRDTDIESNVLPIDENGDGVPEYGMYYSYPQALEEGENPDMSASGYVIRVSLFHDDNTPVEDYAITATPVTEDISTRVGWQKTDGHMYYYDGWGNAVTGLKRIDGKLYFFAPDGVRAQSLGVDVSYYNEDIDWKAVREQGVDFAIVRVGGRGWSSGLLYGDARTRQYLLGARAAGLRVGVYFYSTAVNVREAAEEARAAVQTVAGIPLDFPIFVDTEFSGDFPNGRSDRLSTFHRTEILSAFCSTVQQSGYSAGVYAGEHFYQYILDYNALARYRIWMASYTEEGQLPGFAERYDIWQFTDRGLIPGLPGHVDLNVIF
ncbi:MAG: hypothetical protein J5927_06580 [Oscillospiraceae bacterium]|nr:hypothetical protein [Oscillospiraceae bacterium]